MATPAQQEAAILKVLPYAQELNKLYGFPVEGVLAQAMWESGWGNMANVYVRKHNVWFGIKCHGYSQCTTAGTFEEFNGKRVPIRDSFRSYPTIRAAFLDYGKFLRNNVRYARVFGVTDPYRFIQELGKAGYATASDYVPKVSSIIPTIRKVIERHTPQNKTPSWLGAFAIAALAGAAGFLWWQTKRRSKQKQWQEK